MKQLIQILTIIFIGSVGYAFMNNVNAQPSIDFPNYDVEITVNEDSSMVVEETITHRFNGVSNGLRRDVTVENPSLTESCERNPDVTCGGFNELFIIGAFDEDGNELTEEDGFRTYEVETESGVRYVRFEWQVWDNEFQNDTEVTWTVAYRLWGAIQWRDAGGISASTAEEQVAYFYWNAIAENRGGQVEDASVTINFPQSVQFDSNNLETYTFYESDLEFNRRTNSAILTLEQLDSFGSYTVGYEFNTNELSEPGTIVYDMKGPELSGSIYVDDIRINNSPSGTLRGIPAGEYELRAEALGFDDETLSIDVVAGREVNVDIEMNRAFWSQILLHMGILVILAGCLITPFGFLWTVLRYRNRGRDKGMPGTIYPQYEPPEGMSPYLLGSIKDEKVDKQDIIGSIIDLAYRGYIKIREIKKDKNYELTRINKASEQDLDYIEQSLLKNIFYTKDTIETKDLRKYFPSKYTTLVSTIYKSLASNGYFTASPRDVRNTYVGMGIGLLVIGGIAFVVISAVYSSIVNFYIPFTPALFLSVAGIGFLAFSQFMPAKTKKGSEAYADILGFKMYLETAERYRLQELGPKEFERFLSYAIVFGIEKQWAKKFEGIYEGSPDWYEGSSDAVFDAILLSSLARSFSTAAVTATTPIASSSSTSGGGWSGGGSFGGFSGGGGGGGSVGGW